MYKTKNIDQEFLHTLHKEKIRTQNERAELVKKKLAFITVFFGIGSINFGFRIEDLSCLLYFVPLVAICFDLEIMSANSRIKRIGVFLGRHPQSDAGKSEREWEIFCDIYQDRLAPSANAIISIIGTLCSAILIHAQQISVHTGIQLRFAIWLIASISAIIGLWLRHQSFIKSIEIQQTDVQ
jgi:hypothetical protein